MGKNVQIKHIASAELLEVALLPLPIIHVIPEEEISINTDEWDRVNLMKLSKTKHKVLHLGCKNSQCEYILEEWIENIPAKALGILVDENFWYQSARCT